LPIRLESQLQIICGWEEAMPKSTFGRIELLQGDITKLAVDAIVNAANRSLLGGGGVDGAIHRAAGPELLAECKTLGGCDTGQAKITGGYRLPARHVIHTVGPVFGNRPEDPELLASCYRNSLRIAIDKGLRSIAFPAISCGVYRYPPADACKIAVDTVREVLAEDKTLEKVVFVVFSDDLYDIYREYLKSRG
jgi:O-acetyl-ADP-ribose deacetylase (regulator of RNase III)